MSKYAIIESGNRQYLVHENDVIHVEKVAGETGKEIELDHVLLVKNDEQAQIGNPFVKGAKVRCEIVREERQPKVIHYRHRRRKNSRRKKGHRQTLMLLKVKAIEV